jgi:16S rRNA (uracil1498-N3)-methyltransferase
VPTVLPVVPFRTWLGTPREGLRLTLDPSASTTLRDLERPTGGITLLVGPEGGFGPREREDADAAGYRGARMGPRILRTETAALAALAAMQTLWGDFA